MVVRVIRWVLLAVILFACGVAVHLFYAHIERAPAFEVDDSVGNVCHAVANLGRAGYPSLPLQAPNRSPRHRGFYNYGPPFVYGGGLLVWLFGTSLTTLRSLHLLGILFVCGLAIYYFRRWLLAASGVVVFGTLVFFLNYQWPMIRPDMISVICTFSALLFIGEAMRESRPLLWGVGCFFAASAFVNHGSTYPIVIGTIVLWLLGVWFQIVEQNVDERKFCWKQIGQSLLLCLCGASIPFFVMFWQSDFRVGELFNFWWGARNRWGADAPYLESLLRHWRFTVPGLWWVQAIFVGLYLSGILVSYVTWRRKDRRLLSLVLPPTVYGLSYQILIGIYPNWHAGYALLSQLLPIWIGGSCLGVLYILFCEWRRRYATILEAGITLVIAVCIAGLAAWANASGGYWNTVASRYVDYNQYRDMLLSTVPYGGKIWGSSLFGSLESGTRFQNVYLPHALWLASQFKKDKRAQIAPDFIVWGAGDYTIVYFYWSAMGCPQVKQTAWIPALGDIQNFLGIDSVYRLSTIVHADPYGTYSLYYRENNRGVKNILPSVFWYSPTLRFWVRNLESSYSELTTASCSPLRLRLSVDSFPPLTFLLRFKESGKRFVQVKALSTRTTVLPKGIFLVELVRPPSQIAAPGIVLVTSTHPELSLGHMALGSVGSQKLPAFAPFFARATRVFILFEHSGGPVYFSQFGKKGGSLFEPIRAYRLVGSYRPTPVKPQRSVIVKKWVPATENISVRTSDNGILVRGDSSRYGYQVMSDFISVPPNSRLTVTINCNLIQGAVAFGVLDHTGKQWLVPPNSRKIFSFNTADNDSIRIVVSNNDPPGIPSRFFIRDTKIDIFSRPPALYIDQLVKCYLKNLKKEKCPDCRPAGY